MFQDEEDLQDLYYMLPDCEDFRFLLENEDFPSCDLSSCDTPEFMRSFDYPQPSIHCETVSSLIPLAVEKYQFDEINCWQLTDLPESKHIGNSSHHYPVSQFSNLSIQQQQQQQQHWSPFSGQSIDYNGRRVSSCSSVSSYNSSCSNADGSSLNAPWDPAYYGSNSGIGEFSEDPDNMGIRNCQKLPPTASPDSTSPRRRGRRRKNQLWQFFLRILSDSKYQECIQWEDRDNGTFRFVDSKKVAQLWGSHKKRDNMSFEYLSRAIRYYYQQGIMSRVCDGRRLVYKFGPNAEGWRNYAVSSA